MYNPHSSSLIAVPQALLVSRDAQTNDCQEFAPSGAAWLTSNADLPDLYQTCIDGGTCSIAFYATPASGTLASILVTFLESQDLEVQNATTTTINTPPQSTTNITILQDNNGFSLDPWMPDSNPDDGNGGGYQQWQNLGNKYNDGHGRGGFDGDDPGNGGGGEGGTFAAIGTAALGIYLASDFAAASMQMLVGALVKTGAKTLVEQVAALGLSQLARPLLGEIAAGAIAGSVGDLVGAGLTAAIPVVGQVISLAIVFVSLFDFITGALQSPPYDQAYQINEYPLIGPYNTPYWAVTDGSNPAPPPFELPLQPPQFKGPYYFVPPQYKFDPYNIFPDGVLKYDPWPKVGYQVRPAEGPQSQPENVQPPTTEPQTTEPQTSQPRSIISSIPASASRPTICTVNEAVQTALVELNNVVPAYNFWTEDFNLGKYTFTCSLSCNNCSVQINQESAFEDILTGGGGQTTGNVSIYMDMTLACAAPVNYKDIYKKRWSKPVLWGYPIFKKVKNITVADGPLCSDYGLTYAYGVTFVPFKGKMSFGFQATKQFHYGLFTPDSADTAAPSAASAVNDGGWDWSVLPLTFSGFGAPTVCVGLEISPDWGYGLSTKKPILDIGLNLFPNVTFGVVQEQITTDFDESGVEDQVCELPFTATLGEQPYFFVSMTGRPVFETAFSPIIETLTWSPTLGCLGNISPMTTATATSTSTSTATPYTKHYTPEDSRTRSTTQSIYTQLYTPQYRNTTSSSSPSSASSSSTSPTSFTSSLLPSPAYLYPPPWNPNFVYSTAMFATVSCETVVSGQEVYPAFLTMPTQTTTLQTITSSSPRITKSSSTSRSKSTTKSVSTNLKPVKGIYNTTDSCGYIQEVPTLFN